MPALPNHPGHLRGETQGKLDDVIGHLPPMPEAERLSQSVHLEPETFMTKA